MLRGSKEAFSRSSPEIDAARHALGLYLDGPPAAIGASRARCSIGGVRNITVTSRMGAIFGDRSSPRFEA